MKEIAIQFINSISNDGELMTFIKSSSFGGIVWIVGSLDLALIDLYLGIILKSISIISICFGIIVIIPKVYSTLKKLFNYVFGSKKNS